MGWKPYALRVLAFSFVSTLAVYCLQRFQGFPAAQPAGARRSIAGPGVQHGNQLCDQHELAGLRRRIDAQLPHADAGR